ncbi:hypothetical protein K3G39_20090 [Pontibacter sp. HSC-14F20]|uniref:hypothetical protein n=1 Tax=Pontibacter sp. HSC-14F20 TaxID=2864136 RepID=UPI001C731EA6|nr:hypothetical protein [Pontibacter sp. HSC-14F20]MBX0335538.1 hypothetical protein [Pontibacter sp. HSC-14F20]
MEKIFTPEPGQWGLRGDPFLWESIRAYMSEYALPKDVSEFETLFHKAFKSITGEDLVAGKEIFIKSFDKGGMSSGFVSNDWWLNNGLPLLIGRFKQLTQNNE